MANFSFKNMQLLFNTRSVVYSYGFVETRQLKKYIC